MCSRMSSMKNEVGLAVETGCTGDVKLRFMAALCPSGSGEGRQPRRAAGGQRGGGRLHPRAAREEMKIMMKINKYDFFKSAVKINKDNNFF